MIKIDEGKFNAKGDYFKLTTEFEVLCRCFREMLVERLGEDEKVESEPKREEKLAPEFKPEEPTGKSAFANFLNDFLKF